MRDCWFTLPSVLRIVGTLTGFFIGSCLEAARLPTLADAFAIQKLGRMDLNERGDMLAVEARGGIVIFSKDGALKEVKFLKGSHPCWSPDGRKLAFFANLNGDKQIEIWRIIDDAITQITDFQGGVSPNNFYYMGDPWTTAWSPDSQAIAFCSRWMPDYKKFGQPETDTIRVYRSGEMVESDYYPVLEGIFAADRMVADEYDLNGTEKPGARLKAISRVPSLGLNRLFVVNVETKALQTLGTDGQYFFPAWSADGKRIAAISMGGRNPREKATVFWNTVITGRQTALHIINCESGEERKFKPERTDCQLGPPTWSANGETIALTAQYGYVSFQHIEACSVANGRWHSFSGPRGTSFRNLGWRDAGTRLLVRVADRFTDTIWTLDTKTGQFTPIGTGDGMLKEVTFNNRGEILYAADGPRFVGRIYETASDLVQLPQLLLDSNRQLDELTLGIQRRVSWQNKQGDEVDGIVIYPVGFTPGKLYPMIVDAYPQPARDKCNLSGTAQEMGQLEAARGYVVFLPAVRAPIASFWAFSRDEEYTRRALGAPGIPIMLDDLRSGIEYLVRLGIADPDRIGIFGHSNGSFVANFVITETDLVKCAALSGVINDKIKGFPYPDAWPSQDADTGGDIYDNFDVHLRLSPIFRMNRVNVPVLLLAGDRDVGCEPMAIAEFGALRRLGKDVTLVRYTKEPHKFVGMDDIEDSLSRVINFFDQHLKGGQK